jgi:FkbM family methyltransferase
MRRRIGDCLRKLGLYPLIDRFQKAWERRARPYRRRRFHAQFLRSGDLCFDVGANRGDYAELFLGHGARVVCVEPLPVCQEAIRKRFEGNPNVILVAKGLDAEEGARTMAFDPASSDVATMSPEHIDALRRSGRLDASAYAWTHEQKVSVTTLDRLIAEFGMPRFCKIDVEGFELQVLTGLTLSFEYIPERVARAGDCIRRLAEIGNYRFNYSLGESMRLYLRHWVSPDEMLARLPELARWPVHGDIYARFEG